MLGLSRRLSIRMQLLGLFALVLAAAAAVLLLDEAERRANARVLDQLREESVRSLRRIKKVSDAYGLDYVSTTFRVRNDLLGWDEGVRVLDAAKQRIDENWARLAAQPRTQGQREMINQVAQQRVPADRAAARLRGILVAHDLPALGRFADNELFPAMDPVTKRLKALSDLQLMEADKRVEASLVRAQDASRRRLVLTGVGLLLMLVLASSLVRNIYRGVESLRDLSNSMRMHDYDAQPRFRADGELGEVLDGFLEMRDAVRRYEAELNASEAAAREANQAKSSFLAVMSHEIRTPMIGVTGMLEVLSHSGLDAEQRRTIAVIQQSAAALLQIVGDILDFSKAEAGRIELAPTTVSLRALLQSVAANFAGSASSKGLVLGVELDPALAPAHVADGLRLRQILSNFVSNAIKFTAEGSITIGAASRGREPGIDGGGERESLELRVTDTGIGVSPEQQARLFQPFSQAEGDTTRRYGGTGLGLVISQRLAELMGGGVSMASVPGEGTTMSVALVLPVGDPADLDVDGAGLPGTTPPPFQPRPLPSVAEAEAERSLVLVVDDHPTNRLVIGRQLALAGYASECAEDGQEGLACWRSGRFALVLSDVHMPVMDGYQMARRLRAEEAERGLARTPLVALTAAALAGEAERCLAAGMDDYLAKPVSIPALAACLRRWLPHTAPAPAAAAADVPAAASATAAATLAARAPGAPVPRPPPAAHPTLPQALRPPLPLDAGALAPLTGGDPAQVAELLRDFMRATAEDLAALVRAREAGDPAELARQAHRLAGSSRLVGATELAQAAKAAEVAAKAADWARLLPLCADVLTSAERLRLYVEAEYPGCTLERPLGP